MISPTISFSMISPTMYFFNDFRKALVYFSSMISCQRGAIQSGQPPAQPPSARACGAGRGGGLGLLITIMIIIMIMIILLLLVLQLLLTLLFLIIIQPLSAQACGAGGGPPAKNKSVRFDLNLFVGDTSSSLYLGLARPGDARASRGALARGRGAIAMIMVIV